MPRLEITSRKRASLYEQIRRHLSAIDEIRSLAERDPRGGNRRRVRGLHICASVGFDSAGFLVPYVASWSTGAEIERYAGTIDRIAWRLEAAIRFDAPGKPASGAREEAARLCNSSSFSASRRHGSG